MAAVETTARQGLGLMDLAVSVGETQALDLATVLIGRILDAERERRELGLVDRSFVVWGERKVTRLSSVLSALFFSKQAPFPGLDFGDIVNEPSEGFAYSIVASSDFQKGRPILALVNVTSHEDLKRELLDRDSKRHLQIMANSKAPYSTLLVRVRLGANEAGEVGIEVRRLKDGRHAEAGAGGQYYIVENFAAGQIVPHHSQTEEQWWNEQYDHEIYFVSPGLLEKALEM